MYGPVAETVDGFQADIEQRAFVLPHSSLTRSLAFSRSSSGLATRNQASGREQQWWRVVLTRRALLRRLWYEHGESLGLSPEYDVLTLSKNTGARGRRGRRGAGKDDAWRAP